MVNVVGVSKGSQSASIDIYECTPYSECRAQDCVFNVTEQDATCPNCGMPRPFRPRPNTELAAALSSSWVGCYLIIAMLVLASVLAVVAGKTLGRSANGGFVIAVTTAISILVPLVIFKYLHRKSGLSVEKAPELEGSGATLTLKSSEGVIQQRMRELKAREQQLTAVMERAKNNTGEQWDRVRETLKGALDTVRSQSARYNLKLTEIKLVRWQNRLAPQLYGWEGLGYEQNEARLKALEATRDTGSEIQSKVLEYRKVLGSTPDVEELSTRLEETLASYRKVHEGMVARQAVLALQGVSPVREALSPASLPTAGKREVEVFNAQVAITDFSHSFAELEAEYARLQGEADVGQEISRILERTRVD
jgi:hypothetical protein